ncbi:MAG TPA: HAMP domain-containing sensor histidine kinase [Terriglobales bacterium]|nr:HAMP domain-containing sensor histidine kinase [Terriglobales bacterium]
MKFGRYWWLWCAGGFSLAYLLVSLIVPRNFGLTVLGDISAPSLLLLAAALAAANAVSSRGQTRAFWILIAVGFALWTANQLGWTYYELVLRRQMPDPYLGDIVLFIHIVPLMAAVALRPHRPQAEGKLYFSTLNLLMLVAWWVFLYAFIVFPDEYVVLNTLLYSRNYDLLYLVGNLLLVAAFGVVAAANRGAWKKIYWNMFAAGALYTVAAAINVAIGRRHYYTGCFYDVPLVVSFCWFVWVALLARREKPSPGPALLNEGRWIALAPRIAMLAILSLPAMGLWAFLFDDSPLPVRRFRLLVTLVAILVLGAFVFLKQYLLDHELVRLLHDTHRSFENLQRLQVELVQKEKLAALGQTVAGAAHEINNPLAAILGYADLLSDSESLSPEQLSRARKIGQQARRTRDLVADLLSFAQQNPAEKSLLDIGSLLHKAIQSEALLLDENLRLETRIQPDLPRISGNANQLFQACTEIISNAVDSLNEVGGGTLAIAAFLQADEIVLEFSDTGRGVREPSKVFDPFYTTKPIGKGTGLGLSATYGVVQNHQGHITCYNKSQGGALFVVRLPVAKQSTAVIAGNP